MIATLLLPPAVDSPKCLNEDSKNKRMLTKKGVTFDDNTKGSSDDDTESMSTSSRMDFTKQSHVEEMLLSSSSLPRLIDNNIDTSIVYENQFCMHPSDLDALKQLKGNQFCVDCGKEDPDWASVSLGVLLCVECCGQHRSLGTHVSKVRSIRMDSWSEEQLQMLYCGGNSQCQKFLQTHFQDTLQEQRRTFLSLSAAERYDCAAGMLYQQVLIARREGLPEPTELPDYSPTRRTVKSMDARGSCAYHIPIPVASTETKKEPSNKLKAASKSRQNAFSLLRNATMFWSKNRSTNNSTRSFTESAASENESVSDDEPWDELVTIELYT